MNGFPTRQQVERIKERYPSGTKIRMEHMARIPMRRFHQVLRER